MLVNMYLERKRTVMDLIDKKVAYKSAITFRKNHTAIYGF